MMTIKHIPVDGPERLLPVGSVTFDPDADVVTGHGGPDGDVVITDGRVYVMNDAGKTVGAYAIKPKK